ncbi:hypothetical protein PRIPAC_91366 [Pristionchus pacificus]|uniref:Uncharacterized protein n=1 Tax=Pristionchus pacificus TaxID=54126 RepID=A0A2A6CVR5_PRIPA|nr:hypothetical protein PRIPAC_91366 [Pristionchus pacificus]|eukprot:PDM82133.1 hypothetical protein PRIPAC_36526 [Pristionchus pacificus]
MITDNFVWKSIATCFMCKRGQGRITPTPETKAEQPENESADSKINKLVILADGGDAPIKNALEIPSNGISDDGSRMMAVESMAVRGVSSSDDAQEISDDQNATASKTQTITVGTAESLPPLEIDARELDVERLDEKDDSKDDDNASKLPPIYQHLQQRRRPSTATTVASTRPKSSGPYARISFIQEQRALASVNYKRERLEAIQ